MWHIGDISCQMAASSKFTPGRLTCVWPSRGYLWHPEPQTKTIVADCDLATKPQDRIRRAGANEGLLHVKCDRQVRKASLTITKCFALKSAAELQYFEQFNLSLDFVVDNLNILTRKRLRQRNGRLRPPWSDSAPRKAWQSPPMIIRVRQVNGGRDTPPTEAIPHVLPAGRLLSRA